MNEAPAATVLVVDDNPSKRYAVGRLLRASGFLVMEAANGQDALDLALRKPDAIVLDVNLPDIDGFEVCRIIRGREKDVRTPIIHLSATFVETGDKVIGLEGGADGYLTHPVEAPVLVATVNAFIRARRAEEKLLQSERRFRAIFDRAPTGFALLDAELNFVEINPALGRMLGIDPANLAGGSWPELAGPGHQAEAQALRAALDSQGEAAGELDLQRPDGTPVVIDWNISSHSTPGVWMVVASDVTQRKLLDGERERLHASERGARTDAERANRIKDEFLATVSHELRSPLQSIVGWSQLLGARRTTNIDDYREGVAVIERNARIQAQLIADLLDVSRISVGKLRLQVEEVDVGQIIADAVASARRLAMDKSVRFEVAADTGAGAVRADPVRLQQILSNLLSNAIKCTPAGGTVTLSARELDGSMQFVVLDDGAGISPDFLPHVFENFRQEDGASTRQHEGLGLGLTIVKKLVDLHGGTIQAASSGRGQGSSFEVRIPMAAAGGPGAADASDSAAGEFDDALLQGLRVLVVDDDADARTFVIRLLEDHGVVATEAAGMDEAWERLHADAPQLLISDNSMPGADGYDLIRRIRAGGYDAARLPAIALTAFAQSSDRARALESGFQLHLAKPVNLESLLAAVARLSRLTAPTHSD
jgi:PAS domain S-box-containing protein